MAAIREQMTNLLDFLQPLLPLANCHMVDFFTKKSYCIYTPPDIRDEIEEIGHMNAVNLTLQNDLSAAPNLKIFADTTTKLTLKNCSNVCLDLDSLTDKLQSWGCSDIDKFKLNIFMNAKKSHEVEILSGVVASLAQIAKISHVVDLGDGKGYLSSMLALRHQIPVLGIDASNINTCGAVNRANKLSRIWGSVANAPYKSVPKKTDNFTSSNVNLYKQATQFVDENFNLQKLIEDVFVVKEPVRVGLVGLHTCGALASTSLKIFHKNTNVRTLCNVGCCYHLLTERFEEASNDVGFPLSKFLTDKGVTIGRNARMIANQSVDRILDARDLPNKTIFYRAVLQVLLEERCAVLPTKQVGKFRKPPQDFTEYARVALRRLDREDEVGKEDIEDVLQRFEHRLDELNLFYLLRCKLAPVIESLILLDRVLFLQEQGIEDSFLVRFFDPVVSPRCYGIVAVK